MGKLNKTILCEMLVHTSLCTHKNPKKVLCVNSDNKIKDNFNKEFKKHNIVVTYSDSLDAVGVFDVIIFATKIDNSFDTEQLNKKLGIDGVFVGLSDNYSQSKDNLKDNLKTIGDNFWISMPFFFSSFCAILTSKVYHPQADLILQRSDMLDNLEYYNSEIHNSSFILPTFIKKDLSGVSKF
jgi:spermidine synthase